MLIVSFSLSTHSDLLRCQLFTYNLAVSINKIFINWQIFVFVFYTLVRIHISKNLVSPSSQCWKTCNNLSDKVRYWLLQKSICTASIGLGIASLLQVHFVTTPEVSILRCLKQWTYNHLFYYNKYTREQLNSRCQETPI